ncbi:NUDIX hydrolase [Pseudochrobactrum kiredjianiae]|uniref:NUDIX domain-containing protein n=1 Tax=Pseudochrobactrum kiredjianiae TaxID=386305 RepID=A0ABW3V588_9HYPH|nr:NUDIX hydrolase [Pseudochrobactrum kiredjianiae]MDM7851152.1 NUDIX hydrolase [Pseudochrobactrum kiredjianiae]
MQDIVQNKIYPVQDVRVLVEAGEPDYVVQNRLAIDKNWPQEIAANPTLFDGEIYLAARAELRGGVLTASYQRTGFRSLLYWRKDKSADKPFHIFGSGVIVSSDNQLLLGQMASHNAVAGRIYFPAGSNDDQDIVGGQVDFAGNARREVLEETGIDLGNAVRAGGYSLVMSERSLALFRCYYFDRTADQLQMQAEQFIASQEKPELSGVRMIGQGDVLDERSPPYIRTFTDWYFTQ